MYWLVLLFLHVSIDLHKPRNAYYCHHRNNSCILAHMLGLLGDYSLQLSSRDLLGVAVEENDLHSTGTSHDHCDQGGRCDERDSRSLLTKNS